LKIITEVCALALLGISATCAQQYIVSTYAGGVAPPTPIPGVQAYIGNPQGVAIDRTGNVYFSGLNCVFKLDPTGVLTLAAGNARLGYSGDGGPAANAQLNTPQGVTVDAAGNLYVAEDNRVRKVSPSGTIITVAGNGSKGYSGDVGHAISAQISTVFWPPYVNSTELAVDVGGSLYIADSGNNRVRKVSPTGVITTVAGTGSGGYSGDGGLATNAQFSEPTGVAVDTNGSLYIADLGNSRIRKVSPTGIVTTVAGSGIVGMAGDGGPAVNAQIGFPSSVAVDASGNIYIGDPANNRIRKVSAAGIISTVAGGGRAAGLGDGADASNSNLSLPLGVAADSGGNLYIADWGDRRIRKVSAAGVITTVAGGGDLGLPASGAPANST
jgi:trimeric autotransporter adhesin